MISLSFFSDYKFLIIIVIVLIIYFVYDFFVLPKKKRSEVKMMLEEVSKRRNFKFSSSLNKIYDFKMECANQLLFIKVVYIPSNSAITINSRNTWSLTYGGNKARPGRKYPNQRYLDELIPFLNWKGEPDSNGLKVIIVHPDTEKIQRYLNESELAIIKYSTLVYDYKVITYNDFDECFHDLV